MCGIYNIYLTKLYINLLGRKGNRKTGHLSRVREGDNELNFTARSPKWSGRGQSGSSKNAPESQEAHHLYPEMKVINSV